MPDSVVVAVFGCPASDGLSATRFGRAPFRDAGLRLLNAAEILGIRGGYACTFRGRGVQSGGGAARSITSSRLPATDGAQRLPDLTQVGNDAVASEIFNICERRAAANTRDERT